MESLGKTLPEEMARVEDVLSQYESIPQGKFAAHMIKRSLNKAKIAIESGDVIEMIEAYKELCEVN